MADREDDESSLKGKNILTLVTDERNYVIDNYYSEDVQAYLKHQRKDEVEKFHNSLTKDELERLEKAAEKNQEK